MCSPKTLALAILFASASCLPRAARAAGACSTLQLAHFKERWAGQVPPCDAKKLFAVEAGCAAWSVKTELPAPAAWERDAFGSCEDADPRFCRNSAGSCEPVSGWCLSDYKPAATFDQTTLPDDDSPALSYCCCPGPASCWRATRGKTLITYDANDAAFKQYTDLADLDDAFEGKANAFLAVLATNGATASITNTIRPPVKALVMHATSCLYFGCKAGAPNGCASTCPLDRKTKQLPATLDKDILAAAKAAMGATKNPWRQEDYDAAVAYMRTRTFMVCKGDKDEVDHEKTLANGRELMAAIGISTTTGASITSNHMRGTAVDMTITWGSSPLSLPLGSLCSSVSVCDKLVPSADASKIRRICTGVPNAVCTVPAGGNGADAQELWALGASYGVLHYRGPKPDGVHWSADGS